MFAGSIGRAVECVGLQPLDCWDCGFESRRGHGCFSVTNVSYGSLRPAESLVQRSPTECGVSECDHEPSTVRRTWPTGDCCAMVKKPGYLTTKVIINLNMKCNVINTYYFTVTSLSQGGDDVYTTLNNTVKYVGRRGQFYCKQEYDTSLIHCLLYTRKIKVM
jgi:hypothetical protein